MTVPLSKTARFQSVFYEKPSTEYNYWFSTDVQNYQFLSLFDENSLILFKKTSSLQLRIVNETGNSTTLVQFIKKC